MRDSQIHPLHPALGAEITGLGSLAGLSDGDLAALRAAFDRYHLLLFRGLDLTAEDQLRFCARLRPVSEPPAWISNVEAGFHPESQLLFHCDYAFTAHPMLGLSLYAVELDPAAVPTRFSSNRHAFDALPGALLAELEAATVVHTIDSVHGNEAVRTHLCELGADAPVDIYPRYARPALWTHPVLGRPVLFVLEQQASHVAGWSCERSEALFDRVHAHQYGEDNVYEHQWSVGDFVVWDNLALQHGRRANPDAVRRSLRRVAMNTVTTATLIRGTGFDPAHRAAIAARLR